MTINDHVVILALASAMSAQIVGILELSPQLARDTVSLDSHSLSNGPDCTKIFVWGFRTAWTQVPASDVLAWWRVELAEPKQLRGNRRCKMSAGCHSRCFVIDWLEEI